MASKEKNKKGTKCDVHENNIYHMFCTDCDYLVCPKCTQRQHQNHATTEISDTVIMKKKSDLQDKLRELNDEKLGQLQSELKILQRNQQLYSSTIEDCIIRVKNQGESLKQEVDKITEAYVQELIQQEKSDKKFLKNMENKMAGKLSDLKELIKLSEEKLAHEYDTTFVKFVRDTLEMVEKLTQQEEKVSLAPPTFLSREVSKKDIRNIFGDVKKELRMDMDELLWIVNTNIEKEELLPQMKVKVISSFENMQSVNCLCAINEREAWIGGYNYLNLVTREGRKHKSIKLGCSVNDIAKCRSGEILIAIDSEIKKLTPGGETVKFADVSPYTAQGICITKDNTIFACLRSEIEGKVIKVTNKGQITQTIQYDKDDALLLRKPGFITCTDNGNIWITEESDNSVVVINKNGEVQFTYIGPSGIKLGSPFSPKDLTSIRGEQVLINDCRNHAVHLVDKSGNFVQFVMSSEDGLRGPRSVCVDPFGYIWITCWYNNAIIVAKYSS